MFLLTIGINISHFANDETESQRREVILFQVTELLRAGQDRTLDECNSPVSALSTLLHHSGAEI